MESSSAAGVAGDASAPRARANASIDEGGRWRSRLLFALNFLRHPLSVGTAFESSPALVRRLLRGTAWSRCRSVVELGPGVGTVTGALLRHLGPDATLLAVERNAEFVAELHRALPDPRLRVVHGDAEDLPVLLQRHGMDGIDALVSGIPFSTLPAPLREAVLDAAVAALHPRGELVVYQHSALLLPLLRARFAQVGVETEWRSLVPMRVFRCSGPIAANALRAVTRGGG